MNFRNSNNYPCWGCDKRRVGCHSECAGYIEARKRNDEFNAGMEKIREQKRILSEAHEEGYQRMRKLVGVKKGRINDVINNRRESERGSDL